MQEQVAGAYGSERVEGEEDKHKNQIEVRRVSGYEIKYKKVLGSRGRRQRSRLQRARAKARAEDDSKGEGEVRGWIKNWRGRRVCAKSVIRPQWLVCLEQEKKSVRVTWTLTGDGLKRGAQGDEALRLRDSRSKRSLISFQGASWERGRTLPLV